MVQQRTSLEELRVMCLLEQFVVDGALLGTLAVLDVYDFVCVDMV